MMKNKINDLKEVIRQFSLISQELLTENQFLKEKISYKESEIKDINEHNKKEVSELREQIKALNADKKILEEQRDKLDADISKKKKENRQS